MGLRDRVRAAVRKAVGRVSGEYSAAVDRDDIPYERPRDRADWDPAGVRVERARLRRPGESAGATPGAPAPAPAESDRKP
jgi:hypothetical protein